MDKLLNLAEEALGRSNDQSECISGSGTIGIDMVDQSGQGQGQYGQGEGGLEMCTYELKHGYKVEIKGISNLG